MRRPNQQMINLFRVLRWWAQESREYAIYVHSDHIHRLFMLGGGSETKCEILSRFILFFFFFLFILLFSNSFQMASWMAVPTAYTAQNTQTHSSHIMHRLNGHNMAFVIHTFRIELNVKCMWGEAWLLNGKCEYRWYSQGGYGPVPSSFCHHKSYE